jgi:putative tryptophan/tyrosine transport system substrate-binding protein
VIRLSLLEDTPMTYRTLGLLVTLALGLLVAPLADAQPVGKVPRIGVLGPHLPAAYVFQMEAFRQGLRELGYIEGQHLVIEYRYAEENLALPALAAELVHLPVDVLVTWTTPAIQAAQQATTTIPIVMAASGDPIRTGFVTSLARPGGNITGLTILSAELSAKRLELLTQLVPGLARVAVLWNPANPAIVLEWQATQEAARRLGVQVQSLEIRGPDDFARAFAAATQEHAQALYLTTEALFAIHRTQILDFAARSRLPTSFHSRPFVEAGGLMSYGPNHAALWHRAATYVDKIRRGAKPADLPVEQPTTFELVINLKTAQALELTIPPTLLFQATEVIR